MEAVAVTREPQHLVALRRANRIRLGNAALKQRIFAGLISVIEAVESGEADELPVEDLLRAQRRWGRKRTSKALTRAMILPGRQRRRVRELTTAELRRVLAVVRK